MIFVESYNDIRDTTTLDCILVTTYMCVCCVIFFDDKGVFFKVFRLKPPPRKCLGIFRGWASVWNDLPTYLHIINMAVPEVRLPDRARARDITTTTTTTTIIIIIIIIIRGGGREREREREIPFLFSFWWSLLNSCRLYLNSVLAKRVLSFFFLRI